jgi:RNA polymerase sigma factor (sigma-70 family)
MDKLVELPILKRQQSIKHTVQNYGKRLFSFIRSRVNSDEDAEDILQDVWYQLSSIIDLDTIEYMSSWLYSVSKNKIVDKMRKQTTSSLDDMIYEDEEGEIIFPEAFFAENTNPETEFDKAYFKEAYFKALNELPEKQREVFIWNEMDELTLQEIADKSGESIKTIISRKRYAVAYLRARLQNLYN